MPAGRKVFRVPVGIDRAWAFLSDMQHVGSCVPGCERVAVVDDRRSEWTVRAELGPFSRVLRMAATTVDFEPPRHGAFLASGKDMETRGDIDLRELGPAETEVTYSVQARALGFARGLMDNAIALVIQDQAERFAANVIAALGRSEAAAPQAGT
jgi:carbon monoxide dehydrogenase subunit G